MRVWNKEEKRERWHTNDTSERKGLRERENRKKKKKKKKKRWERKTKANESKAARAHIHTDECGIDIRQC